MPPTVGKNASFASEGTAFETRREAVVKRRPHETAQCRCHYCPGWKNFANLAENVSLLGFCATLVWFPDAAYTDPLGTSHLETEEADNASSSLSVRPFGWV